MRELAFRQCAKYLLLFVNTLLITKKRHEYISVLD